MLECFSDGALCPEKWLVLLHTHTIQFPFLQCTCCVLRIPLLSLLTHHSTLYMLYILHKITYDCPNFIALVIPSAAAVVILLL